MSEAVATDEKPKPINKRQAERYGYKVICISMYEADVERNRAKVDDLKRRGFRKMNLSRLIRIALAKIDLDRLEVELRNQTGEDL